MPYLSVHLQLPLLAVHSWLGDVLAESRMMKALETEAIGGLGWKGHSTQESGQRAFIVDDQSIEYLMLNLGILPIQSHPPEAPWNGMNL